MKWEQARELIGCPVWTDDPGRKCVPRLAGLHGPYQLLSVTRRRAHLAAYDYSPVRLESIYDTSTRKKVA